MGVENDLIAWGAHYDLTVFVFDHFAGFVLYAQRSQTGKGDVLTVGQGFSYNIGESLFKLV